ncbi:MAG: hypothetical protein EBX52_04135, partial [Proteobacteria bacterium]|nr:hypothetical protein [Pseudomonadota bacterium]
MTSTEANLRTFIEDAGSRSIGVHLLVGNGGSYLSVTEAAGDLYPAMSLIAGNAAAFSATLSGTKAVALHWDVEPQQLADFTANRQLYIQRLVNALQRTRGILSGSGLKQAADIQHHWDHPATEGATTCDPSNNLLTPAFTGQLGYQCLFRLLDQVVIMDYRDDPSLSIGQV